MTVKNFAEWTEAVEAEAIKLREVLQYLNESGKRRYDAYNTLSWLAQFYETAGQLIEVIDSKKDLNEREIADLETIPASLPIKALRKIAEGEQQ